MQNKGYVIGIVVVAAALLLWSGKITLGENPVIAVVPGGLAVAMGVAAYRVSKAESFAPKGETRWEATSRTPGVQAWLKDKADVADRKAAASSGPPAGTTKPRA